MSFRIPATVLLGLAVVGAWLIPATAFGGTSWFMDAVVHQSAGRAVDSFAHVVEEVFPAALLEKLELWPIQAALREIHWPSPASASISNAPASSVRTGSAGFSHGML